MELARSRTTWQVSGAPLGLAGYLTLGPPKFALRVLQEEQVSVMRGLVHPCRQERATITAKPVRRPASSAAISAAALLAA